MTVIAGITLFPGEVSGRKSGYKGGIRPNHYFPQLHSYAIGKIKFLGTDKIELGERRKARVEFLEGPALRETLIPGTEWEIREAEKIVGRARVVEIVTEKV